MPGEDSPVEGRLPYINGIDEYCDRWCENCAFTRRCYAYAMDEGPLREGTFESEKDFLDAVDESLILPKETMKEILGTAGIDFTNEELEAFRQVYKDMCLEVRELPLPGDALRYAARVGEWFETTRDLYEEAADEIRSADEMGIGDPQSTFEAIERANEVIARYRSVILEKVVYAFASRRISGDDSHYFNGSAKVALICIDNSIASWQELEKHFLQRSDTVWEMVVLLEKMRKGLEQEFPGARMFIRPGFDQEI